MNHDFRASASKWVVIAAAAVGLLSAQSAMSATVLLDFGPTAVTGSDRTLSPGHATGALSAMETTWNQVGPSQPAADATGLLSATGGVTNVAVDLGMSSVGSSVIDFAVQPDRSAGLAGSANTGICAGSSALRDAIFSSTNDKVAVGLKLTGLEAGTYDLFVTGGNTNQLTPQTFHVSVGADAATFSFVAAGVGSTPSVTNSTSASFVEGDNYAKFTVTVASGQAVYLAAENYVAPAQQQRGFLNSVAVVEAVPEPTSVAGLGLAGLALGLRRRRA